MLAIATVLWKRLDTEGHDACRLVRRDDGWQVCGEAIFLHEGKPCSMRYDVRCDAAWRTRLATVNGWVGARALTCEIVRSEEATWLLNGVEQPQASGCVDVDLGFTPATNLLALRRFNLSIGEETPAPAAYLSFPELRLDLSNRYIGEPPRPPMRIAHPFSATSRCWKFRRADSSPVIRAYGKGGSSQTDECQGQR